MKKFLIGVFLVLGIMLVAYNVHTVFGQDEISQTPTPAPQYQDQISDNNTQESSLDPEDLQTLTEATEDLIQTIETSSLTDPSGVLSPASAANYSLLLGSLVPAGASFSFFITDAAHPDGTCDYGITTSLTLTCYFDTPLQQAVDSAAEGSTIIIGSGTFTEQVAIQKSLTLQGAGMGLTTIASPAAALMATAGSNTHAVLSVASPDPNLNSIMVYLSGFTVDGNSQGSLNDQFTGIHFFSASGSIFQVAVRGVDGDAAPGERDGIGILADHPMDETMATNLTIYATVVEDYQQAGIVLSEPGTNGVIQNSLIQGGGTQTGIGVEYGAHANILNNTITQNGTGVVINGNALSGNPPVPVTTIAGNNLTDNQTAVLVVSDGLRGYGDGLAEVTINRIFGNMWGVINANTSTIVDAENNWWGCNQGPVGAGCDPTLGNVDFDPWLTLSWLRSSGPFHVVVENSVELYPTLSVNSDGSDTWGINYFLPDGIIGYFSHYPSLGEVDPNPLFTLYDDMPFIYTAFQVPGTDLVCVTVDQSEICARISVSEAETILGPGLPLLPVLLYLPERQISATFPGNQGVIFQVLERMGDQPDKEWARFTFPAWILPAGSLITLTRLTDADLPHPLPENMIMVGDGYNLDLATADGNPILTLNWSAEFRLTLPADFSPPEGQYLTLLHYDSDTAAWVEIPFSLSGEVVTGWSNLPGTFILVARQP